MRWQFSLASPFLFIPIAIHYKFDYIILAKMTEPPSKKIKPAQEFINLIDDCYLLRFRDIDKTEEKNQQLEEDTQKIREILEQVRSSSDVSFGPTRLAAKINWGKCLGLMLESGPESLKALKVLTDTLSPGGGLL